MNIEKKLTSILEDARIPGLAIALIRNGKLAKHYNLGLRDIAQNVPVLEDTVFEAASLSKPVFAYAVMRLAERGVLNLDQPLIEYFHYEDILHDEQSALVTARMILSHKSGLVGWRRESPLHFISPPGAEFNYSGEGYVYLQKTIEELTQLSLQEFVEEELFHPLGMKDSSFIWKQEYLDRVAIGYNEKGEPEVKNKPLNGNSAYTLHTTCFDYVKFLLAIIQSQGLKKESMKQMLYPEVHISPTISWGLGFGLQYLHKTKSLFQWGDNGCFKCFMFITPKKKEGVVYFTNSHNGLLIAQSLVSLISQERQPVFDWLESII